MLGSKSKKLILFILFTLFFEFFIMPIPSLASEQDSHTVNMANIDVLAEKQEEQGKMNIMTNDFVYDTLYSHMEEYNVSEEIAINEDLSKNLDQEDQAEPMEMGVGYFEEKEPLKTFPKNIDRPVEKRVVVKQRIVMKHMTAYNSEVSQCDASPCITASGFNVCKHGIEDTVAANFLPLGAKIRIPDYFGEKIFVVRDRMNSRYQNRVDVWMKSRQNALNFGVRYGKIEILQEMKK